MEKKFYYLQLNRLYNSNSDLNVREAKRQASFEFQKDAKKSDVFGIIGRGSNELVYFKNLSLDKSEDISSSRVYVIAEEKEGNFYDVITGEQVNFMDVVAGKVEIPVEQLAKILKTFASNEELLNKYFENISLFKAEIEKYYRIYDYVLNDLIISSEEQRAREEAALTYIEEFQTFVRTKKDGNK